ncbi:hypothetical protein ACIA8G_05310 [Lentzea sp. NPDC051213]|uniref:hypothetical protein n=1 Tax=Lentzea sp. NPDC051213 TaxID=3364126 RepID=UPI0037947C52
MSVARGRVFLLWHVHHVATGPSGETRHFGEDGEFWADEEAGDDVKLLCVYSSKENAVMSSDGSRPVIATRAQAAASSTGHGPGEAEQVEFTAPGPALDCYSVVLVNRAGNGTYTLSVS